MYFQNVYIATDRETGAVINDGAYIEDVSIYTTLSVDDYGNKRLPEIVTITNDKGKIAEIQNANIEFFSEGIIITGITEMNNLVGEGEKKSLKRCLIGIKVYAYPRK